MHDSISNLIIKIKNASESGKASIVFPYSKMIASVAEALEKYGYVETVSKKGKKSKIIEIKLLYKNELPAIVGVKRISKFSKRTYRGVNKLQSVRNGSGSLILSTPKGIITDKEARKLKVGGEALFEIW
ncbi:MAG: 30S ribosomal protein S8 [Candidatus Paceibacterota bacterium]|jgi:small subunit ribosomal protein S8